VALPFDSGTLWLNVMNWALGGLTVACILAVVVGALWPPRRSRKRMTVAAAGNWLHSFDAVGLTMADGGKPIEPQPPADKPAAQ